MWVGNWGNLKGKLVVVSGPSGSGKSTIIRRALRDHDLNIQPSISATTRPRRPGEQDGVDYHFKEVEEFRRARDRGEFLEWAEYNGHLYGTPAEPVHQALSMGRSVLLEIEVRGARQIREKAPSSVFIFIRTSRFQMLEERLRRRGTEDEARIYNRLVRAREELEAAPWYDVQLNNDDLDRCVEEFVTALKANGCGPGPGG